MNEINKKDKRIYVIFESNMYYTHLVDIKFDQKDANLSKKFFNENYGSDYSISSMKDADTFFRRVFNRSTQASTIQFSTEKFSKFKDFKKRMKILNKEGFKLDKYKKNFKNFLEKEKNGEIKKTYQDSMSYNPDMF